MPPMIDRPPNVLFLMSDEHRADVTGYEGNRVVRTPTLDRLAATGTVFRNAYTPSPICIPGRQAMMVGQLPRTCGCEQFGQDVDPGAMTFARRLAQHAYMTACSGKLHHVGPDQMQGWMRRVAADLAVDDRFIDDKDEAAWKRWVGDRNPRWKWPQEVEVLRARPDDSSRNQRFDDRALQAARDFIEDYFIDLTYDRATPRRPLLLKLSLLQPHYPYIARRERLAYYFNRVTPYLDQPVFDHPFLSRFRVDIGSAEEDAVTPREVRRATAAYYGMIEDVDDKCGQLLGALEHAGQDPDDWIILYTSDHGEMLGEHGVWEKQKFFEGAARVPLIVRLPRRLREAWGCEGNVVQENVNLCDLFATLCELCGVEPPLAEATYRGRGLDSRSLVPLLQGHTRDWHSRYHNETISQFGGTNLLIKRDALKYQRYDTAQCREQPEVLFDLTRDPTERENLIDKPEYAEVLREFRRRSASLGFGPEADAEYRNAGYEPEEMSKSG